MSQDTIGVATASSRRDNSEGRWTPTEVGALHLVPSLLSITKSIRGLMGLKLADLGLFPGQDELLFALSPDTTASVSALANVLAIRPSTASKMLDRLETVGLVERVVDARDARLTLVRITPSGIEMQGRCRDIRRQMESELDDMPNYSKAVKSLSELQNILRTKLRRLR